MKITLEIPEEMRCLCISGVMGKGGKLLLLTSPVWIDNMYDGAEFKALWGKTDET